jgi:hypothetical protein
MKIAAKPVEAGNIIHHRVRAPTKVTPGRSAIKYMVRCWYGAPSNLKRIEKSDATEGTHAAPTHKADRTGLRRSKRG